MNMTIDNIDINYIVEGEGPAIVMLHGWGSNLTLFNGMIKHLAPHYKVYALDMPGFGKSAEPHEPWSVDDYANFVIKFIKEMGITDTILLGHSFGGKTIIKLVNKPDLGFNVNKLILMGSAGVRPKKTLKQKIKIRVYKIGKAFLKFKPIHFLYPQALENLQARSGSADYRAASPMMKQTFVKVVNEHLEEYLPNIKQPTLLVWGKEDTATPLSDGKYMEEHIPDAGLVALDNAGHYVFLDQAYTVCKVLDSFLNIKE